MRDLHTEEGALFRLSGGKKQLQVRRVHVGVGHDPRPLRKRCKTGREGRLPCAALAADDNDLARTHENLLSIARQRDSVFHTHVSSERYGQTPLAPASAAERVKG